MVEINVWMFDFILILLMVVPFIAANVLGNDPCNVSYELGLAQGQLIATQQELQAIKAKAQK